MASDTAFEKPITIAHVLSQMQKHAYVLPAIQREFVWSASQVCDLFDSLMRGYPIGSFLFWRVEGERVRDYVYYDFIREYHQKTARHCPKLALAPGSDVTAILDGQQRITALNIGLRGSYAAKLPRLWWNNPDAFPKKKLYLDLCSGPSVNSMMKYRFRFLTPDEAAPEASAKAPGKRVWFLVKDILDINDGPDMLDYLLDHGYAKPRSAYRRLDRLHKVVHVDKPINYYLEKDQDLDKVLTIFIRTNKAGTPLSYSDMLLSIAVAQWRKRDAREEIHSLVDRLNEVGQGFGFSKDLVLKSGLVITNANDIRFRAANFNNVNMAALEDQWDNVSRSLLRATQLLADFGLSRHTLRATNVLIPVAYYLAHRKHDDRYVTSPSYQTDRKDLRFWVMRSLVKAGVWGSGLDTLLKSLCEALRDDTSQGFPTRKLENAMTRLGKSLRFEEEEIEDLAESDRNVFPLLALIYRDVNLTGECHVDHIFPKRRFTKHQLQKAGVSDDHIDEFIERRDRLPNLQLLEGPANLAKSDMLPRKWLEKRFPDRKAREAHMAFRDMHDLPERITEFLDFYEARRNRIEGQLRRLLGRDH